MGSRKLNFFMIAMAIIAGLFAASAMAQLDPISPPENSASALQSLPLQETLTVNRNVAIPLNQSPQRNVHTPRYQFALPSTLGGTVPQSLANPAAQEETRTVDLSGAIARYAESARLSLESARLETLIFLAMTPRTKALRQPGENPTYERVGTDKFLVTANRSFFVTLPSMLRSLEMGKRQVAVRCQMITIEQSQAHRLNAFLQLGSAQVNCTAMPTVIPVATAGAFDDNGDQAFVSTSTTIRENTPVTTGKLTAENLEALSRFLKQSTKSEVKFAPVIHLFPGQVGKVADVTERPFVVGLDVVKSSAGLASTQPVVQAIEDGTTIQVRAIPNGDQIILQTDIAISEVIDVNTYTFTSGTGQEQQSIQIPKQGIRQVNLSTRLGDRQAIMIDPNFVESTTRSTRFGQSKVEKKKTIFVLQVENIRSENPRAAHHVLNGVRKK